MGLDFNKRRKGESKREYAARMLGGNKEDYDSDGNKKSGGGSSSSSSSSSVKKAEEAAKKATKKTEEQAKIAFAPPTKTSEQLFQELWASKGMEGLKGQVSAIDAQINSAKADLTKALGVIDENPWLSESSRVGRGNRLNNLAAGTVNNLIGQRTGVVDTYNNTLTEINGAIGRNSADFTTNQGLAQGYLAFLTGQQETKINAASVATASAAASTDKTSSSGRSGGHKKLDPGVYQEGIGYIGKGTGYVGGVYHGQKGPDGVYFNPNEDMGYIASPEYANAMNGY
jgi:hypothetical protein